MLNDFQPWIFYTRHFNALRMQKYLTESRRSHKQAKALYVWNANISAALWELIAYVEVALRNLISYQLAQRQVRKNLCVEWVLNQNCDVFQANPHMAADVETVVQRMRRNNKVITQDRVVADLPFGFWHQTISKTNVSLWPDIASGFKGLASRRQEEIAAIVFEVRNLRNRIGHHHRIYNLNLEMRHENLLLLAHYIDPEFGIWLRSKSRVEGLLALRPQTPQPPQTPQTPQPIAPNS